MNIKKIKGFKEKVLFVVSNIKKGSTLSYKQVAEKIRETPSI